MKTRSWAMTDLVSVIVVSRHRPAALRRCVLALRQQDLPQFEVIVVADPDAIAGLGQTGDIKTVVFDQPNISAARNLGLAQAAGTIAAYIDDDAAAEPTWLRRLTAPFARADVTAATGFIRGRNGISYQWQACEVDNLGADHPLDCPQTALFAAAPTRAVKTQGTNCAFRTSALRAIGGFDPAFHFYLEEADVNLRLGGLTAVVPDAQVHHGYLASARRGDDRVPKSLYDIGASTAVFLRKHAAGTDGLAQLIEQQSARVNRHVAAGRLTAQQAAQLLQTLVSGWQDGAARTLIGPVPAPEAIAPFIPFLGTGPRGGVVLSGRIWSRGALLRRAKMLAAAGGIVTVICLSPTLRPHRAAFTETGFWLQSGGIWGRSNRAAPRIIWGTFAARVRIEIARISPFRPTQDHAT